MRVGTFCTKDNIFDVYVDQSVDEDKKTIYYVANGQPIMYVIPKLFSPQEAKDWVSIVSKDIKKRFKE